NVSGSSGAVSSDYPYVVFSDGFESGGLGSWDSVGGNGTVGVVAAAAHGGGSGLRFVNGAGQFGLVVKNFAAPLVDSSVSFWLRVAAGSGVQTVAQARDQSSGQTMWALLYDGARKGFWFYPFRGTASSEVFTGANSAPL